MELNNWLTKEFYWNRDLLKKSIKADNYIENKFVETRGYYKLNLEFPQYTKGFHWLLKAHCGYKLDSTVLKAAKLKIIVSKVLNIGFLNCSSINEIRNDVLNNLDIVRSFFNSDTHNVNSENSGNNSGNNSKEIGLNNSYNEISNNNDSVNENLNVNNLSVNNLK
ncbi:hypothetical protein PIROE2DRAFT_8070, partial [Piromyces sp. E2]